MDGMPRSFSRRSFVFGISALAGGLVAVGPLEAACARGVRAAPVAEAHQPEITVWVVIEEDDTTTIRVARSEMGQGAFTALPMLVADDLDCDWARVQAEYASPTENLARGRPWGDMVTAGSLAVRSSQLYLRTAGAQARAMLVAEAAARWRVSPDECTTADSIVSHARSGRTLRYGKLASAAAKRPIPKDVRLKHPEEWKIIGKPLPRLEARDKIFGQPIYALDVQIPDMLYATVSACPTLGGQVVSFDARQALGMPGVRHVVTVEKNAVAVVADSWWQARRALSTVVVTWDHGPGQHLTTDSLRQMFASSLDADDAAIDLKLGDIDAALRNAAMVIKADYEVPYLAHTTMEPQTCTAHVTDDSAEVWAPTQNGEGTLRTIARALGMDPLKVTVHKCHLGGGFGRRGLAQDWARQAVLISRAIGKPVKMVWTREEDVRHDVYRPFVVARQSAGFDRNGRLIAWKVRLCGSSNLFFFARDRLQGGHDLEMLGAFRKDDMLYDVPNFEAGYVMRNTTIPVGFWRGVNHSQNCFFRESFVDELAHSAGKDPYLFRRQLYEHCPRSRAVLDEAAKRSNWGRASTGHFQGLAIVECYNTVCAHVVELSVTDAGHLQIHRIVCVIDPVYVVNPHLVKIQLESAVAYGLIAALKGQITVQNGQVDQSNFHDYPALRMNEMPKVETYLLPSGDRYSQQWGGVGEPGLPPLAPAITNAIFAATGVRIRSLPILNHKLTA
ncbi:UNVERIFIED_ORG: isoquinoline 1-oxidoreductase beta subunit [Paraburkholderia sediminicola]|nr:isoquinoline 1-oxidoreductase beta subunit [Paraburkholderia sediminicola]